MPSEPPPLTDDQWAAASAWLGSTSRDDFEATYNRLGTVDLAIGETINRKISVLLEQPGSFSAPSGLSVTVSENIRSLKELLAKFENQGGLDGQIDTVGGTRIYKRVRDDLR